MVRFLINYVIDFIFFNILIYTNHLNSMTVDHLGNNGILQFQVLRLLPQLHQPNFHTGWTHLQVVPQAPQQNQVQPKISLFLLCSMDPRLSWYHTNSGTIFPHFTDRIHTLLLSYPLYYPVSYHHCDKHYHGWQACRSRACLPWWGSSIKLSLLLKKPTLPKFVIVAWTAPQLWLMRSCPTSTGKIDTLCPTRSSAGRNQLRRQST